MQYLRLLLGSITFLLAYGNAHGQFLLKSDSETIKAPKTSFSMFEVKAFYGIGKRSLDLSNYQRNDKKYFEHHKSGKDLTLELSTQIYNALSASVFYSQHTFSTRPDSLVVESNAANQFVIIEEAVAFNRVGGSFNVQGRIKPNSGTRVNLSIGATKCYTTDKLTYREFGEVYSAELKNKTIINPFVTIGLSSSILVPQLQLHFRFTRYFGEFGDLKSDDDSFIRYTRYSGINSLVQNSFQLGLSWIFITKG